jgi:hypothetical protein
MATLKHPQRTVGTAEGKNEAENTSKAEDLGAEDIQGAENEHIRSQKARKHSKENAGTVYGQAIKRRTTEPRNKHQKKSHGESLEVLRKLDSQELIVL